MADQEKKAQWIMHLTVCLCGILILGKAVQAKLEGYARPGQYMLHRAVAFLAEEAGQLFLPAVTATEESDSLTQAAVGQMAAFFGWTGESEQGSYIEDEYTRQELIEAGRGGSLQEIQEENRRQSGNLNEKKVDDGAGKTDKKDTQDSKDSTALEDTQEHGSDSTTEIVSETGQTKAVEEESGKAASDNSGDGISALKEQGQDPAKEESSETVSLPSFQQLIENQEKISPEKLLRQFFVVDPVTEIEKNLLSYDILTGTKLELDNNQEGMQIVIYHTHSQEMFSDSIKTDPDTTIVGVGTVLEKELTKRGYRVLHLTDTFDLTGQSIDRNKAYTNARKKLVEVLRENPTVQVLLDIHRDGVAENKHLVTTINGRPTAQIMFFNGLSRKKKSGVLSGLENPYLQENLAFSFQTEYLCDLWYPGFSRCIYLKAYRYNLDLLPRSMLVEVGAQTNTVEEAKNAMLLLADVLHKLLQGTS